MPRCALAFAFALLPLAVCFQTLAAEPEAAKRDEPRQFAIECRIVDRSSDEAKALACPKVTVFAHKRATISELIQRPFVVAVSDTDGGKQPVIEVLSDGWTIDLACHASGPKHVTVDLTIEEMRIVDVEVRRVDGDTNIQVPQVDHSKLRRFVTRKPGESFIVALDGKPPAESNRYAEFVVNELAAARESLELRGLAPGAGDDGFR